jgi:capsule polysaccharide export protein KpsE/RkpR
MSAPDVQKLGGPQWFAVAFGALIFGVGATFALYEKVLIPALQEQARAAEQRAEQAEQQLQKSDDALKQWRAHAQELDVRLKAGEPPAALANLQASHAQCLRSNEQWQSAHAKAAAAADLRMQVEQLDVQYQALAASVVQFTFGICRNTKDPATCDLVPSDQRTLQSMQVRRDHAHARLMQLQDKFVCAKP